MKKIQFLAILLLASLTNVCAQQRWHEDFSGKTLSANWNFLGKADPSKYVQDDGRLRLYGDVYEPRDHMHNTFLGLPHHGGNPMQADTHLMLFESESGDEAGMCVYQSDSCYAQLCMSNYRGEYRLKLKFQLKGHQWLMTDKQMTRRVEQMWLRVVFESGCYKFYYSTDGEKYTLADSIEKILMSPVISGSSAEPLVGLYAFMGNSKYQTGYSYADFEYFDYQSK